MRYLVHFLVVVIGFGAVFDAAATEYQCVIVQFETEGLIAEPSVVDDHFILHTTAGPDTVEALHGVVRYEPLSRHGTRPDLSGKWVVWLPAPTGENLTADGIRITNVIFAGPDAESGVNGDYAKAEFPPHDLPSQNEYFCGSLSYQRQHHFRLFDEAPMEGDWCSLTDTEGNFLDHDMDCPQAWGITIGDPDVIVAVIDYGMDWRHPTLGGPTTVASGTVSDSLYAYDSGCLYLNPGEMPGDHSGEGRPGVPDWDDDGDGLVDEDSWGQEPSATKEPDVLIGLVTGVDEDTIHDANANFTAADSLVGKFLTGNINGLNGISRKIISYTSTSLTTKPVGDPFENGWVDFILPGDMYWLGDKIDNDGDGVVDNPGYLSDLADDDDENGYPDDLRGWDFVNQPTQPDGTPYEHEDYFREDNDTRSRGLGDSCHGTGVAALVAGSWEHGRIVGVAPGVKVLPIRAGYVMSSYPSVVLDDLALGRAVSYAAMMGADIIVTTNERTREIMADSLNQVLADHDIVLVQAAGNLGDQLDYHSLVTQPKISVAGLYSRDRGWVSTNHGEHIDVSARAVNIVSAAGGYVATGEYWWADGTSFSAPLVAGVCALVKSTYPHWTRDEIIAKVVSSVDEIYSPPGAPGYNAYYEAGRWLGSGRVNAYKAITLYGTVGSVQSDTTWTGEVWVSGDIHVPEGVRLTLAPGTNVHLAASDILDADSGTGTADLVEFVVAGELICAGTATEAVVFDHYGAEADTVWGGIVVGSTQQVASLNLAHTQLRSMAHPIRLLNDAQVQAVDIDVVSCSIHSGESAISLAGLPTGSSLTVDGSTLLGSLSTGSVGVEATSAAGATDIVVHVGTATSIEGYDTGIYLDTTGTFELDDVQIDDCGLGLEMDPVYTTLAVVENLVVSNSSATGILQHGGVVNYSDVDVSGSGDCGMHFTLYARPVFGPEISSISASTLHGLYMDAASNNAIIEHVDIQDSGNSGIKIQGCTPTVRNSSIQGPGAAGVTCDDASPVLTALDVSGVTVGIRSNGGSAPTCRQTSFSQCSNGLVVDPVSAGDFGNSTDDGLNTFQQITLAYVLNLNVGNDLLLLGNCFDGSENPPASRFSSKYLTTGTVLYLPGYCE